MSTTAASDPLELRSEPLGELGFYTLAGHSDSPRDLVDEVRMAEELGLGSVFISERFNLKDAPTLCGAAAAITEHIGIATAATNHNTRHPLVTASFATTCTDSQAAASRSDSVVDSTNCSAPWAWTRYAATRFKIRSRFIASYGTAPQ